MMKNLPDKQVSRDELICEIVNLRREITGIYKAEASGMISLGRKF
jgi:hypothetical protein